jgi:hypothetical protein
MLTVGQLRKSLEGLDDETIVYYMRIEDEYFTDKETGLPCDWTTIDKHLVFNYMCRGKDVHPNWYEDWCKSHYVPAESAYPTEDVFVINAHY